MSQDLEAENGQILIADKAYRINSESLISHQEKFFLQKDHEFFTPEAFQLRLDGSST